MRYFPLGTSDFKISMGLQALKNTSWIDIDDSHDADTALKRKLLTQHPDHVFAALPSSQKAQEDILTLVQAELKTQYPDLKPTPFIREGCPLATAASLVQEDLVLMQRIDDVFKLTAACVCFPSGWNLTEKIGLSMPDIHAPVPDLNNRIGPSIDRFFDNFNPRKKVQRFNWGIFDDAALFQPEWRRRAHPNNEVITPRTVGQKLFFRVEKQTLQRLPSADDTLFTIRIFNTSLEEVTENPERAEALFRSLKTMPDAMRRYKAVARYEDVLLEYLETKSS